MYLQSLYIQTLDMLLQIVREFNYCCQIDYITRNEIKQSKQFTLSENVIVFQPKDEVPDK